MSKAVEWDFLVINPLRKLKPYKVDSQGRTRYLSEDEEIRLRIALKDRETEIRTRRDNGNRWRQIRGYGEYPTLASDVYVDHIQPIVLLGMNTGLRRGAIFRLQKSHVDLEKRILTAVGENSKNGKTQYIPLNDEAHAVLSCWLRGQVENDSDYVFPSQNGKPIRDIKHAWGGILRRAKITGVRFHDMRHHFASRLVINGVPLNTVRELLDHSAFKLTLRYAHLSPSATAAAVATLNQPAKEQ
ncbi:site-specific integrase [Bdellovibrionota bacterium FG-2]